MKALGFWLALGTGLLFWSIRTSSAAIFLLGGPATAGDPPGATSHNNGNLDLTHASEIVPGFFLPHPNVWTFQAFRLITGPFGDGLSSEPWAGPAPTPLTTDGNLNPPPPEGFGGPDGGAFYKAFTGNASDGPVTIHLSQTFPAASGQMYTLDGWAGAEANFLGTGEFGIDFFSAANALIASTTLNLNAAGLFVPNGQPFNYKKYSVSGVAPAGTASVRARSSVINGLSNPAGGGQAFVVDDFTFVLVPEPAALMVLATAGGSACLRRSRRC